MLDLITGNFILGGSVIAGIAGLAVVILLLAPYILHKLKIKFPNLGVTKSIILGPGSPWYRPKEIDVIIEQYERQVRDLAEELQNKYTKMKTKLDLKKRGYMAKSIYDLYALSNDISHLQYRDLRWEKFTGRWYELLKRVGYDFRDAFIYLDKAEQTDMTQNLSRIAKRMYRRKLLLYEIR